MSQKKKRGPSGNVVARNRKARRDYDIKDTFEAGLELTGTEVKSLRAGRASINEAFATDKQDEMWLVGATIPPYEAAGTHLNHEPSRDRKLLLKRKEIASLLGSIQRKGMTLVPLAIYFNKRGIAKCELGLGEGRGKIDKRELVKQRDWNRQKQRLMRDKG
jgi:SsrA-binding protein